MDFFQRDFLLFIRRVRPMKRTTNQAFHQNPKFCPIPLEDFDQCAPSIAEREHTSGIWSVVKFQFNNRR